MVPTTTSSASSSSPAGLHRHRVPTYDTDWDSEAYLTVSGQNSNNSVRVTDDFLRAVETDGDWKLTAASTARSPRPLKARDLWDKIGYAAWACADPGHPVPHHHQRLAHLPGSPAAIRASNPCSEYMFLDDTACNLASLNLLPSAPDDKVRHRGLRARRRLWTVVLEISVMMAQFPSKEIAELSYDYRTLGLGYANIGGLLMTAGIPYDSDEGRAICGALTAIMTGVSYATSAEMAKELGAFPGYDRTASTCCASSATTAAPPMAQADGYEGCRPAGAARPRELPRTSALVAARESAWDRALALGEEARLPQRADHRDRADRHHRPRHGLRHHRHRARLRAGEVQEARRRRLLQDHQPGGARSACARSAIRRSRSPRSSPMPSATARWPGARHQPPRSAKGFGDERDREDRGGARDRLRHQVRLQQVDARRRLLQDARNHRRAAERPDLRPAAHLGFTKAEIEAANIHVCGAMTLEGAPHLKAEHLPVFDCANPCGRSASASLGREPHPHDGGGAALHLGRDLQDHQHAERRDGRGLQGAYMLSWKLALKANALYRDGSKLSQPLLALIEDEDDEAEDVRSRRCSRSRRRARIAEKIVERIVERDRPRRAREAARPPQGLHPEGRRRRPQGLSAHRRIRRRPLGEIFIDMHKEGAAFRAMMNNFAIAVSLGLQYGVPLEEFVDAFTFTRFEPAGMVQGNDSIKNATSILDYVFRELASPTSAATTSPMSTSKA
jgi:ribonucleoside-diphosphate reductase alpha chain